MDQRDRTQWLYAHFQAISKAASRYLLLLFIAAVLGLAVVLSSSEEIKVPIFLIVLQRHWLLSGLAFYGLFLTLAYCGNFEKGEETLQKMSEILNVDYRELDFVDTFPTVIDYARHARTQRALRRTVVGRFVAMMIYSIAVVGGYLWFWCLLVIGIVSRSSPLHPALLIDACTLVIGLFTVGAIYDFVQRRWQTFLANEQQLKQSK